MTGRFTLTQSGGALEVLFGATVSGVLPPAPRYNICPTQTVAVVTSDGSGRRLRPMRWGFLPAWYRTPADGPLLMIARADTIASRTAFREAVRLRRCLLPASGFYEWEKVEGKKLPWYFTRTDGAPMAFAGVWQRWESGEQAVDTVAIVSTEPGPGMRGLHHRETVMIEPPDWPLWLGEAGRGASVLMRASAPGVLAAHRVGGAVNSNRAEGAALIEPLAP
jgi:putative SOS response-associated peptidase YedK